MKIDESVQFKPDFGKGLLPVIAQDAKSKEILMLAWMNEEAWQKTLETGEAHYYSRSRQKLWHKGETSGHIQKVISCRLDCDNDAILLLIDQTGAACHTGHISCFFRELIGNRISECSPKVFNPDDVYGKKVK